jgi:opacity protein-like surface antigen
MKKFNLSLVAVLAMSTFAMAGGDIAPVEPMVETPMVEESTGAFYLGLAYGAANYNVDGVYVYDSIGENWSEDVDYDTVMLQAGYKFNPYIAVEGRYWFGFDEDISDGETLNIDTWGLYVKPMYPVTESFDIYGLLGYASSDMDWSYPGGSYPTPDMDGFSWGIGAAYDFTDNISVFVDYTDMYDDDDTIVYNSLESDKMDGHITSWNFGATYTF